jgi:hypothetical protein
LRSARFKLYCLQDNTQNLLEAVKDGTNISCLEKIVFSISAYLFSVSVEEWTSIAVAIARSGKITDIILPEKNAAMEEVMASVDTKGLLSLRKS